MELQYSNGVRLTKLQHEMSNLDVAIENYEKAIKSHEQLAKKHFSDENAPLTKQQAKDKRKAHKKLTLTQAERDAELKESLEFLEHERRHLENIEVVHAQLAKYREEGLRATKGSGSDQQRQSTLKVLENEEHHPTKELEAYMRAEAVPKPTRFHTAHHILPGKGRWRQVELARARTHMHKIGIRINDPANGVYLISVDKNTPHWTMPGSGGHRRYHTSEYEGWVASKVRQLTSIDFIKTQLQLIGRILQENEPKDVIEAHKKQNP